MQFVMKVFLNTMDVDVSVSTNDKYALRKHHYETRLHSLKGDTYMLLNSVREYGEK